MVRALAFVLILVIIAFGLGSSEAYSAKAEEPGPDAPNVLLVVVDDQSYRHSGLGKLAEIDGLDAVTFKRAFTNNPVCCPSRATMLTGLYDHHTGVTNNGAGEELDDSQTLNNWFDAAGYHTALFGKYLNRYPFGDPAPPPGWDQWLAFTDSGYNNFSLLRESTEEMYAAEDGVYSTDLLASELRDMVTSVDRPFLAVLAPWAAHGRPIPNEKHRGRHAGKPVPLPANFNEVASDAPRWQRSLPEVSVGSQRRFVRRQWETLESVDDAVSEARTALAATGELDNTIIAYVSDNGMSLGSHRWKTKTCPQEECIHVPLLVSAPGIPGHRENALVSNVDLAPTLADLAGVPHPPVDGLSLAPLMRGDIASLRRPVLLHSKPGLNKFNVPSYKGLRTNRWKFVLYKDGSRELYKLSRDPLELKNLAGKRKYRQRMRSLRLKMLELRRAGS